MRATITVDEPAAKLHPPSRSDAHSVATAARTCRLRYGVQALVLFSLLAIWAINWRLRTSGVRQPGDCSVPWKTYGQEHQLRIAMVSMSTAKSKVKQAAGANVRAARFNGLLELTVPNKEAYAARHGYDYIDGSDLLNASRPASWSKLLAVQAHLRAYDWVMWVDADTLITNMGQRLEDLLPAGQHPDLLLTRDPGGVNAGVWFVRSSAWGAGFLQRWWGADRYVRPMGDTKSGDNDALKDFVRDMEPSERAQHVGIAPQCAFNSYLWRHSARNWLRYLMDPRHVLTGLWHPGDFLLHLAGMDNKTQALMDFHRTHIVPQQPQVYAAREPERGARAGSSEAAATEHSRPARRRQQQQQQQ